MVSRSDLVESFLKSVKDAISPLESGFLSFSRDLESHWSKDSRNELRNVEFFTRPYGLMEKKPNLDSSLLVSSSDEKNKGFKTFIGSIFPNSSKKRGAKEEEEEKGESCSNCLHFALTWSVILNSFVQAFHSPFKSVKKCFKNPCVQQDDLKPKQRQKFKRLDLRDKGKLSLELLLCLALDNLVQNIQMFDHRKLISGITKGKNADVNGLLANIRFARVGGGPASLVEDASSDDEGESRVSNVDKEEAEGGSTQKPSGGILNIPLSTVESLKSTLPAVSLTELIEFIHQLGKSSSEHPDKKKLFSVQDFFRYTETEGLIYFMILLIS